MSEESANGIPRFGDIPGFEKGASFPDRKSLSAAKVHRPTQAGISSRQADGADSIVVSGGYEDDEDHGHYIIYTGQGGQDGSGRQVSDQELIRGNFGLAKSCDEGQPVRVVRGSKGDPAHSPTNGYRYDGLFRVDSYWHEQGRSGYLIWRFKLVALDSEKAQTPTEIEGTLETSGPVARSTITTQRIVRSTALSRSLKLLYDYRCQICRIQLSTPAGFYSEGAHIRPLGRPHNGPDTADNILCLCPNHHVLFDAGSIHVATDLTVVDSFTGSAIETLYQHPSHQVSAANLEYHRRHITSSRSPLVH